MKATTCPHCGGELKGLVRKKLTVQEFKDRYKVGDSVTGWSTGVPVRITAIGEDRFLGLDWRNKERVCKMEADHGWKKVEVCEEEAPCPPK